MRKQKGFGTIYMVLAGVILSMAVGGWFYYKDSQATIAALVAQNVAFTIQFEEDKLIKQQYEDDAKLQKVVNDTLNAEFHGARVEVEELRGVLKKKNAQGKTRDIGKLAIQKPKAFGKVFTKGTTKAFRCVELASGAKHTADELAATRRSQINELCTELANPNYLPY